jgi:hypothetical protein
MVAQRLMGGLAEGSVTRGRAVVHGRYVLGDVLHQFVHFLDLDPVGVLIQLLPPFRYFLFDGCFRCFNLLLNCKFLIC